MASGDTPLRKICNFEPCCAKSVTLSLPLLLTLLLMF